MFLVKILHEQKIYVEQNVILVIFISMIMFKIKIAMTNFEKEAPIFVLLSLKKSIKVLHLNTRHRNL